MPTPKRVKQHEELQLTKIEAFVLALQQALERELAKDNRTINYRNLSDADLVSELLKVQAILSDLSVDEQMKRVQQIFANEIKFVREVFEYNNIPIEFTPEDRQAVKALITLEIGKVNAEVNTWVTNVRSVLAQNIILGSLPDIERISDEFGSRFASKVKTELNTSTSMFNGELSHNKATEVLGDDPLMIYVGPFDLLTRPFCRKHIGKVYRLSEVKKMDNGQGLDVVTSKGGYNCRHTWSYVSEDFDASAYQKSVERDKKRTEKQ